MSARSLRYVICIVLSLTIVASSVKAQDPSVAEAGSTIPIKLPDEFTVLDGIADGLKRFANETNERLIANETTVSDRITNDAAAISEARRQLVIKRGAWLTKIHEDQLQAKRVQYLKDRRLERDGTVKRLREVRKVKNGFIKRLSGVFRSSRRQSKALQTKINLVENRMDALWQQSADLRDHRRSKTVDRTIDRTIGSKRDSRDSLKLKRQRLMAKRAYFDSLASDAKNAIESIRWSVDVEEVKNAIEHYNHFKRIRKVHYDHAKGMIALKHRHRLHMAALRRQQKARRVFVRQRQAARKRQQLLRRLAIYQTARQVDRTWARHFRQLSLNYRRTIRSCRRQLAKLNQSRSRFRVPGFYARLRAQRRALASARRNLFRLRSQRRRRLMLASRRRQAAFAVRQRLALLNRGQRVRVRRFRNRRGRGRFSPFGRGRGRGRGRFPRGGLFRRSRRRLPPQVRLARFRRRIALRITRAQARISISARRNARRLAALQQRVFRDRRRARVVTRRAWRRSRFVARRRAIFVRQFRRREAIKQRRQNIRIRRFVRRVRRLQQARSTPAILRVTPQRRCQICFATCKSSDRTCRSKCTRRFCPAGLSAQHRRVMRLRRKMKQTGRSFLVQDKNLRKQLQLKLKQLQASLAAERKRTAALARKLRLAKPVKCKNMGRLRARHAKKIQKLHAKYRILIAKQLARHRVRLAKLQRAHSVALAQLKKQHAALLQAAHQTGKKALQLAAAKHKASIKTAIGKHMAKLATLTKRTCFEFWKKKKCPDKFKARTAHSQWQCGNDKHCMEQCCIPAQWTCGLYHEYRSCPTEYRPNANQNGLCQNEQDCRSRCCEGVPLAKGRCQFSGDPHWVTFDGLHFDCQMQGEHIIYKNIALNEAVHNSQQRFGAVAYTRAIAFRKGSSIWEFSQWAPRQPVIRYRGKVTSITYDNKWNEYGNDFRARARNFGSHIQIWVMNKLTKTMVWMQVGHDLFWNVHVVLPYRINQYKSEGLCGSYDGNAQNDIYNRATKKPCKTWSRSTGGPYPYKCCESWMVQKGESLFNRPVPPDDGPVKAVSLDKICHKKSILEKARNFCLKKSPGGFKEECLTDYCNALNIGGKAMKQMVNGELAAHKKGSHPQRHPTKHKAKHGTVLVSRSFGVNCPNWQVHKQKCQSGYNMAVTTKGLLKIRFDASPGHCSSIRGRIYIDGKHLFTSRWLGYNNDPQKRPQSSLTRAFRVRPGRHILTFSADGINGGCNSGALGSWGGVANVWYQA